MTLDIASQVPSVIRGRRVEPAGTPQDTFLLFPGADGAGAGFDSIRQDCWITRITISSTAGFAASGIAFRQTINAPDAPTDLVASCNVTNGRFGEMVPNVPIFVARTEELFVYLETVAIPAPWTSDVMIEYVVSVDGNNRSGQSSIIPQPSPDRIY